MLDFIRRGQRWLVGAVVVFVGFVFAVSLGVGGVPRLRGKATTGDTVVQLGEIRFDVDDFQRVRERQQESMRQRFGEDFDPDLLRSQIDGQTFRSLVDTAILAHEARELGLVVSRAELQQLVRNAPIFFDEDGRFNKERFEAAVQWEYGSQQAFKNAMETELLREKLVRLLWSQPQVSDAEAREAALYRLEQVRLAYVALDTTKLPPGTELPDAEVEAYRDEHLDSLRATYEERSSEFETPEQVRVRHVVVRVDDPQDEEAVEAAREKAEEALRRLREGEDFEAVAKELSDAPEDDLGFFARGEQAKPLEDAAFALEAGELSDVVRTDAAFHVLRVEERKAAGRQPFEEVALALARESLEKEKARERANQLSEELSAAVREGQSLEEAARERGLTLERTVPIRRRPDGFVEKLGPSSEVMATAFALDLDSPSSPRIFDVDSRRVLIQLLERTEPEAEELEDEMALQRDQLLAIKRNRLLATWIEKRRQQLQEDGSLLTNPGLVIEQG